MKAIVCEKFGPVEDLKYKDMPDPVAGPGQVLVNVKAAGVNFPEALMVQGLYQVKPDLPFIPASPWWCWVPRAAPASRPFRSERPWGRG